MSTMTTVLGVPVTLGCDLSQWLGRHKRAVILTDSNCAEKCLPWLLDHNDSLAKSPVITIEPDLKDLVAVDHIVRDLVHFQAGRDTLLISLGGGTIGDLGGFIASVYKRGMPFLTVPTTLLSMSDSCVGGKTAVDHADIRNLLGTYKQPLAVCIDTHFLNTLPLQVLSDGYAEIIKHAVLSGGDLWHWVRTATGDHDFDWVITESAHGPQLRPHRRACHRGHHGLKSWPSGGYGSAQ
jgi:3-dehydroquinate synthase